MIGLGIVIVAFATMMGYWITASITHQSAAPIDSVPPASCGLNPLLPGTAAVNRAQALATQTTPYPFATDAPALGAQLSYDPRTSIAVTAGTVNRRHLSIERSIGLGTLSGGSGSPLATAPVQDIKYAAQAAHTIPGAVGFNPGVLHVMAVSAINDDGQWNALSIREQTALDATFAAIRRIGSGFFPRPREPWSSHHPAPARTSRFLVTPLH